MALPSSSKPAIICAEETTEKLKIKITLNKILLKAEEECSFNEHWREYSAFDEGCRKQVRDFVMIIRF
jgi:hypothetical protein